MDCNVKHKTGINIRKRVIIIGGGVSGLAIAHELLKFNKYDITIIEKDPQCGGKVQSYRTKKNIGEHSIRAYVSDYWNMNKIFKEISLNGAPNIDLKNINPKNILSDGDTVYDNLVPTTDFNYWYDDKNHVKMYWGNKINFITRIASYLKFGLILIFKLNIPFFDLLILLFKSIICLFIPLKIRNSLYENITFDQYLNGHFGDIRKLSDGINLYVVSIVDVIIAAKSSRSNARLFMDFLTRYILNLLLGTTVNLMNGPVSESLINPWVNHLTKPNSTTTNRIKIMNDTTVTRIVMNNKRNRIRKLIVMDSHNQCQSVVADYYFMCLPQLVVAHLVKTTGNYYMRQYARQISKLNHESLISVQYALSDEPIGYDLGVLQIFAQKPWKPVYMLHNNRTWSNTKFPPGTKCILSVTLSNFINKGLLIRKPISMCSKKEIKREALHQINLTHIKKTIRDSYINPSLSIVPDSRIDIHNKDNNKGHSKGANGISPEVTYMGYIRYRQRGGKSMMLQSPCYVPGLDATKYESDNFIPGVADLYIAGEFTRTNYTHYSLEKVCESARRAVKLFATNENIPYNDIYINSTNYTYDLDSHLPIPIFRYYVAMLDVFKDMIIKK